MIKYLVFHHLALQSTSTKLLIPFFCMPYPSAVFGADGLMGRFCIHGRAYQAQRAHATQKPDWLAKAIRDKALRKLSWLFGLSGLSEEPIYVCFEVMLRVPCCCGEYIKQISFNIVSNFGMRVTGRRGTRREMDKR